MPLRGVLDHVSHGRITGWAWDSDQPDSPVSVVLSANDQVLGRVLANRYRPDLEKAGIGNGKHGFELWLPTPLSVLQRHAISARIEGPGTHIKRSPRILEASTAFDRSTRETIDQLLSVVADEADFVRRLTFLTDQADRLRQRYANYSSGAEERQRRQRLGWQEQSAKLKGMPPAPPKPRALVIDEGMPLGGHDAGSNAVLSHMRSLQRLGYAVSFAPSNLRGDSRLLEEEGITCCVHPWYATIEEVLRRQRNGFDVVYMHRGATASRYVALARDHQKRARLLYSVADLHHLRLSRQADIEGRPELRSYSEHVRIKELSAAWQADAVITHSSVEAEILRRHMPAEKVRVVPWSLIPNPTAVPFAERRGLAFIGGYGHRPNVDAALWLVDSVMPEIEAFGGSLPCLLVGSNMPDVLRNLQRHDVEPVGHVERLSAVFDRVRLTVAPLSFGAGVKGKVLDSLAAGVPCVCTPAAAEGMDLPQALLDLVGSTPVDLARSIRALHNDEALNRACSEAGLAYIADCTSETRVDALLSAAIGRR